MSRSTITSKGQTTIPKAVRDFLNLKPGDVVDFVISENEVVMRSASIDVAQLKGILPKPARALSQEELDTHIKKRFYKKP